MSQSKSIFNCPSTLDLRKRLINPTVALLPWLTHTELLTKKLFDKSGDTSLKILREHNVKASWWERYVLKLDSDMVFHREILTYAYDQPCWYARSILPHVTLQKHNELFVRLKRETLGDLIFGNNGIVRKNMSFYHISHENLEFHWLNRNLYLDTKVLWVRLSEFEIDSNGTFFLVEILLPGIEKYLLGVPL
ncbi:MAG: hypothetical protein A3E88_06865 [Legionellales bacterium RIFCSPHIGHO2_12_FULL_35_11]|nr:MAG: hypothetical protein A3E88_06865 [Legionellales bacterium RIFCSPHIGHO2_12_FULL_35_11]